MDEHVTAAEPQWLDPEEQASWYAFAYVLTLLPATLEAQMQRDSGIGYFDYLVVSSLSMAPNRTLRMSEVAQYTGSSLSRLSNVVGKLEKRGWVERRPDPADGRATLATLTEVGWEATVAAAPGHVAEVRRVVFDSLTKAQQRQLGTVSERLLRAMNAPCPSDLRPADQDGFHGPREGEGL